MATALIASLPQGFGDGGSYYAKAGAAGSPDLPTILQSLIDAVNAGVNANSQAAGTPLTDANQTIQIGEGSWRVQSTTLTANRTKTLGTTGAKAGDQITITRTENAAFTLAVVNGGVGAGTLTTLPASKTGYAKFQFDGTNWALREVSVGP